MNKPTVWVVKEQVRRSEVGSAPMDYTPAMKYGEIRFITEMDLPLHPNSSVAKLWHEQVQTFVREYDENRDWIILTGHTLAIFMIGVYMADAAKVPRVLVWRRESGMYVPFENTEVVRA